MCDELRAGEVLELRVLLSIDISAYQGDTKNKHIQNAIYREWLGLLTT